MTIRPTTQHDIQRDDENTGKSGYSIIQKIIPGIGIGISSTGIDQGTGDVTINFTGTVGGSTNPPITGSFVVQDDGTTLGSALIINAGQNLAASVSGTVLLLDANLTSTPSLAFGRAFRDSGNYVTGSTNFVNVDNVNMSLTLILNQAHRCLIVVDANTTCTTSANMQLDLEIDGTRQGGTYGLSFGGGTTANQNTPLSFSYHTPTQLTSGSHTFKLMYRTDGGSMTLWAVSGVTPLIMTVAEQYL